VSHQLLLIKAIYPHYPIVVVLSQANSIMPPVPTSAPTAFVGATNAAMPREIALALFFGSFGCAVLTPHATILCNDLIAILVYFDGLG
jgi:hypothetical protein